MIATIRSYMDDEITAFAFDEALYDIDSATDDKTVQAVRLDLWYYYDDCTDHNIVASKAVWDHFNRLLLLLTSDAEIQVLRTWRSWSGTQRIASIALTCFILLGAWRGWSSDLILMAIPFGLISMGLTWLRRASLRKSAIAEKPAIDPFPSFTSLRSVRRQIRQFEKMTYPRIIADRRIRGRVRELLPWLLWIPMWLVFSPVVLLFQALPTKHEETKLSTPEFDGEPGIVTNAAV